MLMQFNSFLYRQKQRYKYHTAKDKFEKKVAEINRFDEQVLFDYSNFKIKGIDLFFRRGQHEFILDSFDLLVKLIYKSTGRFVVKDDEIFFYIRGLKLRVQTAEEIFILNEIFFENCYNFFIPDKEVVIIDVGMNVGFASLFFSTKPEVKRIYAFEPFNSTYSNAMKNLEFNPDFRNKIISYNFGWSNSTKTNEVTCSSKNRGRNRTVSLAESNDEKVSVQLYNGAEQLLNIVNENDNKTIIIKMDCEGAEFEIFESLFNLKLPKQVKGIMLEWHFSEPSKIQSYLVESNFKLVNTSLGENTGLIYGFR